MKKRLVTLAAAATLFSAAPSIARDYTFVGTSYGYYGSSGSYVDINLSLVGGPHAWTLTGFGWATHYYNEATKTFIDHAYTIDDIIFENGLDSTINIYGKAGGKLDDRNADDIYLNYTPGLYVDNGVGVWSSSANPGELFVFNPHLTSPLPEPGSWGLMITGFGLAGALIRRRPAHNLRVRYEA